MLFKEAQMKRKLVCYFFFVDWSCISLGLHIGLKQPNIEIHLPFGFMRIGWKTYTEDEIILNEDEINKKCFGYY